MTRRLSVLTCTLVGTLFLVPGQALAQTPAPDSTTAFQVEQLEPVPGMGLNILNVDTSRMLPAMRLSADVLFHYVSEPLVVARAESDDTIVSKLVDDQLKGELAVGFGITEWLTAGVVLPVTIWQQGDDLALAGRAGQSIGGVSINDLRFHLKARILDPAEFSGVGLTVAVPIHVPIGDTDQFAGEDSVRVRPTVGVDWRHDSGFLVAANLGYSIRPEHATHNFINDDAFHYALAVEFPSMVWDRMTVIASLFGAVQTADNRDPFDIEAGAATFGGGDRSDNPMELDAGLRFDVSNGWTAMVGAGGGLTAAVGSPAFRAFLGAGYAPVGLDSDGDGIPDGSDDCPKDPEDKDGWADSDGCPDDDNDGDGISDSVDGAQDGTGYGTCRDMPEDKDGFEDSDGCPDPDNDKDGVPDVNDGPTDGAAFGACLNDPEDLDGFEDADGCPDVDNDKDGILDVNDGAVVDGFGACLNEPEDIDGFEDADGCIDADNDGDKIPDTSDKCPMEPESMNGVDDEDGCPDTKSEDVKIKNNQIVILKKVFFVYSKAKIKRKSYKLLNSVAAVLNENPWITKIRVDGHTDSAGNIGPNLRLSSRRAAAVKEYLLEQGVEAARLGSAGFGEGRPLESNASAQGRAANRRVEFTILEINGEAVKRGDGVQQDENRPDTFE